MRLEHFLQRQGRSRFHVTVLVEKIAFIQFFQNLSCSFGWRSVGDDDLRARFFVDRNRLVQVRLRQLLVPIPVF